MAPKIIKNKTKGKKNIKRSFFEIQAPLTSTKIQLYSTTKESLVGKVVKLDLTRTLRGKSIILKMKIELDGENLIGIPVNAELAGAHIRKTMRRGTDYVEDSFQVECRDAITRVKPLLVTRRRVSRAVLCALRIAAKKQLEEYIKVRTAQEVFSDIMTNKLQKQMAAKLKKIYPLALSEIRVFKVEKFKDSKKE